MFRYPLSFPCFPVVNKYLVFVKKSFSFVNFLPRQGHNSTAVVHDKHKASIILPARRWHLLYVFKAFRFWNQILHTLTPLWTLLHHSNYRCIRCWYPYKFAKVFKVPVTESSPRGSNISSLFVGQWLSVFISKRPEKRSVKKHWLNRTKITVIYCKDIMITLFTDSSSAHR